MTLKLKKKPIIDPLMFDDKCPACGNKLSLDEEKILSTKGYPDLTIYCRCGCGYIWTIREVIVPWMY